MIIQTVRQDPSRSVWIDEALNVSRPDRSGAGQIDAEHQAADLALGSVVLPDPGRSWLVLQPHLTAGGSRASVPMQGITEGGVDM